MDDYGCTRGLFVGIKTDDSVGTSQAKDILVCTRGRSGLGQDGHSLGNSTSQPLIRLSHKMADGRRNEHGDGWQPRLTCITRLSELTAD